MEAHSRPVDVISVCTTEGEIRPLRLRVNEEHRLLRMDIEDILKIDEVSRIGIEGYIFHCRARSEEGQKMLELKYSIRSHSWSLCLDMF